MKRVTQWLQRLHSASPEAVRFEMYRAVVPGHQGFEMQDAIIATHTLGTLPQKPGDSHPNSAILLRYVDTVPSSLESFALATDIGALLCLASDRRVEVAMELPGRAEGDPQIHFTGYAGAVDKRVIGPMPVETRTRFLECLSLIASLPESNLAAIGAACRLHHGSVLLYQSDYRSAYVLLVTALEVLSRTFGSPPHQWLDWEESGRWDELFEKLDLHEDQRIALRQRLLADRHLRLKLTFRRYVTETLPDKFWAERWQEWLYAFHMPQGLWGEAESSDQPIQGIVPKDHTLLDGALAKTYDLRSGLLHRGEEANLLKIGLRSGVPISASEPLPYAVLRAIVSSLIWHELATRGRLVELPDVRIPS